MERTPKSAPLNIRLGRNTFKAQTAFLTFVVKQVALNKSSSLLIHESKILKHYNYLQRLLKQKVFTKVIGT
jgi:hypothetical protein